MKPQHKFTLAIAAAVFLSQGAGILNSRDLGLMFMGAGLAFIYSAIEFRHWREERRKEWLRRNRK